MVTTVTNNSPQAINTSLFSLEKDTDKKAKLLNEKINEINKILDGINKDAGVVSVNGKQGIVTLDASDVGALPDTTTIPSKTSQLTNDSGFITSSSLSSYVPTSRTVNGKALSSNISLTASDVGALPDTTHIPTDPVQSDWTETDTSSLAYIKNKPSLATVATSGSYTDLSDKPTIPAAQVNSDWNASSGVAEILNKPSIPSKTSDLTNDSGFVSQSSLLNICYPVGVVYVQYPGCDAPGTLFPNTAWTELDFGGAFFRASGGKAKTFNSGSQADSVKSHTHSGTTGEMSGDNYGSVECASEGLFNGRGTMTSGGRFSLSNNRNWAGGDNNEANRPGKLYLNLSHTHGFTTDSNDTSATETRPFNYTIRIWKRTA